MKLQFIIVHYQHQKSKPIITSELVVVQAIQLLQQQQALHQEHPPWPFLSLVLDPVEPLRIHTHGHLEKEEPLHLKIHLIHTPQQEPILQHAL